MSVKEVRVGMAKPAVDELLRKVGSKYSLVMAIAQRAKQLTDKRERFLRERETNPVYIAMEEIAQEKVKVSVEGAEGEDEDS